MSSINMHVLELCGDDLEFMVIDREPTGEEVEAMENLAGEYLDNDMDFKEELVKFLKDSGFILSSERRPPPSGGG